MAEITLRLREGAAIVEVFVGPGFVTAALLRNLKQEVPEPVLAEAMIDTASVYSFVDEEIIETLRLRAVGSAEFVTLAAKGTEIVAAELFDASLTIRHPRLPRGIRRLTRSFGVVKGRVAPLGEQVIIGQDLLMRCRFVYDGKKGRFTLAF